MICVTKRFPRSSPLFPVANAVVMRAKSLCSSNVALKEMFGRYSLAIMDCMLKFMGFGPHESGCLLLCDPCFCLCFPQHSEIFGN